MNNNEVYNILNSFKSKKEAYEYFKITPNNYGILKLKELANNVNFNLDVYKERRKPKKKYCVNCGNLIENHGIKFCSHSCSATYTNKGRKVSEETKERIGKSLKEKHPPKIKLCKFCGQEECLSKEACNHHSIKWFKNLTPFSFDENTIGTNNIIKEYFRIKNLLIKEYIDNKLSPKDISKKYNYTYKSENLLHVLKKMNIITRNSSESVHNAVLQGKLKYESDLHSKFKQGWVKKWNGDNIYYRSSYELDYINNLNENKVDYEVEYFRIEYWDTKQHKYRVAIPDIFIKDKNEIIEIKSNFTFNKQNMIDKFNEYRKMGYDVKLILEKIEYSYDDIFNLDEKDFIIDNLR